MTISYSVKGVSLRTTAQELKLGPQDAESKYWKFLWGFFSLGLISASLGKSVSILPPPHLSSQTHFLCFS